MIYWWCYFKYCLWQKYILSESSLVLTCSNSKWKTWGLSLAPVHVKSEHIAKLSHKQDPKSAFIWWFPPLLQSGLKNVENYTIILVKCIEWRNYFTHFEFGIQKTKTIRALIFSPFLLTMHPSDMRMVPYTSVRKVQKNKSNWNLYFLSKRSGGGITYIPCKYFHESFWTSDYCYAALCVPLWNSMIKYFWQKLKKSSQFPQIYLLPA